jgi:hypothetical protein
MLAAVTAAKVGLSLGGLLTADAMRARRPSCFEGLPAAPPRALACGVRDPADRETADRETADREAADRAGERRAPAAGDWPADPVPDAVRPDTVRPDTVRPDTVRPDTVRPEAGRPEGAERRDPDRVGTVRLDTEEVSVDAERAADLPAAGRAPEARLAPEVRLAPDVRLALGPRPATRRPGPGTERSALAVVGGVRSAGTAAPAGRSGWARCDDVVCVRLVRGPLEIPAQAEAAHPEEALFEEAAFEEAAFEEAAFEDVPPGEAPDGDDPAVAEARAGPLAAASRRPPPGAVRTDSDSDSARFAGVNAAAESRDRRALCLGGALCLAE